MSELRSLTRGFPKYILQAVKRNLDIWQKSQTDVEIFSLAFK